MGTNGTNGTKDAQTLINEERRLLREIADIEALDREWRDMLGTSAFQRVTADLSEQYERAQYAVIHFDKPADAVKAQARLFALDDYRQRYGPTFFVEDLTDARERLARLREDNALFFATPPVLPVNRIGQEVGEAPAPPPRRDAAKPITHSENGMGVTIDMPPFRKVRPVREGASPWSPSEIRQVIATCRAAAEIASRHDDPETREESLLEAKGIEQDLGAQGWERATDLVEADLPPETIRAALDDDQVFTDYLAATSATDAPPPPKPAVAAPQGDPGTCRSCGAAIVWTVTMKGKKTPVNPDGESHFSTCPDAGKWRGKKKTEGAATAS